MENINITLRKDMLYKLIANELPNYFIKMDEENNLILVNRVIGINSIYKEYKLNGDESFIELFDYIAKGN